MWLWPYNRRGFCIERLMVSSYLDRSMMAHEPGPCDRIHVIHPLCSVV